MLTVRGVAVVCRVDAFLKGGLIWAGAAGADRGPAGAQRAGGARCPRLPLAEGWGWGVRSCGVQIQCRSRFRLSRAHTHTHTHAHMPHAYTHAAARTYTHAYTHRARRWRPSWSATASYTSRTPRCRVRALGDHWYACVAGGPCVRLLLRRMCVSCGGVCGATSSFSFDWEQHRGLLLPAGVPIHPSPPASRPPLHVPGPH